MPPTNILRIICLVALLALCAGCNGGGGSGGTPNSVSNVGLRPTASQLAVADATSPYRNVLVDCILAETAAQSCSLTVLPLIGQEHVAPSIDDILARTVISHAWMGARFREVLELMPGELLTLMRSVTAIVIASDIRPSNYSFGTGAIYIDPAYLWLDNTEKATISKDDDYRANFGDSLPLVSLWRYVNGDDYAWSFHDLNGMETRTLNDIDRRFAALMFHELAHANDVFPSSQLVFLDATTSVWTASASMRDRRISDLLTSQLPLNSRLLFDLTEVLYTGRQPTNAQLELTADLVGTEFENDGANYDYAYTTPSEDLAMLFEEIMMHHHYAIDRQIAYTDAPLNDGRFCSDYIVRWGFRNRIGDPLVRSRAEFGLRLLLDMPDVSAYFSALPSPKPIPGGANWCDIEPAAMALRSPDPKESRTQSAINASPATMRPDDRSFWH
jgi:hypothetical protein